MSILVARTLWGRFMSKVAADVWHALGFLPEEVRNRFVLRRLADGTTQIVLPMRCVSMRQKQASERLKNAVQAMATTLASRPAVPAPVSRSASL